MFFLSGLSRVWDQIWLTVPFWSKRTDQSQFDLNVISILIWSPEFKGNENEICRVKITKTVATLAEQCAHVGPRHVQREADRENMLFCGSRMRVQRVNELKTLKKIIWMEMKTWGLLISEMPFSSENHVPPDLVIFQVKGRTKCSLLLRASYVSTEDPDFQVRLESDCPHVQWRNLLVSFPPRPGTPVSVMWDRINNPRSVFRRQQSELDNTSGCLPNLVFSVCYSLPVL